MGQKSRCKIKTHLLIWCKLHNQPSYLSLQSTQRNIWLELYPLTPLGCKSGCLQRWQQKRIMGIVKCWPLVPGPINGPLQMWPALHSQDSGISNLGFHRTFSTTLPNAKHDPTPTLLHTHRQVGRIDSNGAEVSYTTSTGTRVLRLVAAALTTKVKNKGSSSALVVVIHHAVWLPSVVPRHFLWRHVLQGIALEFQTQVGMVHAWVGQNITRLTSS